MAWASPAQNDPLGPDPHVLHKADFYAMNVAEVF